MTLQVQKLENTEQNCASNKKCFGCPSGRCVRWMKEEVHIEYAEENPIVR
jgi:hypothetical protein